jgi:hypothetical protein
MVDGGGKCCTSYGRFAGLWEMACQNTPFFDVTPSTCILLSTEFEIWIREFVCETTLAVGPRTLHHTLCGRDWANVSSLIHHRDASKSLSSVAALRASQQHICCLSRTSERTFSTKTTRLSMRFISSKRSVYAHFPGAQQLLIASDPFSLMVSIYTIRQEHSEWTRTRYH